MGSLRRPRARFMSSPVLSDLARFQNGSSALQPSNTCVWNSSAVGLGVQLCCGSGSAALLWVWECSSAVALGVQLCCGSGSAALLWGGGLQANELYTLNESIRWLLKTELGSFITVYLQNQLLTKGLGSLLEKIQFYDDGGGSVRATRGAWSQRPLQPEPAHTGPNSSSLPPLLEQEADAYLERSGGLRRHTVANAHSDIQLLRAGNSGGGARMVSGQSHSIESLRGGAHDEFGGGVKSAAHQSLAETCCSRELVAGEDQGLCGHP
ncbi:hypothetical protein CRUP_019497 [Coryphaenoides rupestris]|nr:hypothetical protein CRUP_019497 [Coryphaenoides rupestris]